MSTALSPASTFAWRLLRLLGVVFLVLGAANLGAILVPFDIGNPDWEFGTVNALLDSMPLFGLGLGLVLAASRALGRLWVARGVAVVFLVLALVVWAAAALYATNLPLAFRNIRDPNVLTVIKKAAAKATVQAVVYPFGFLWIAVLGWRGGRRGGSRGVQ